jgi:hypothetical protein
MTAQKQAEPEMVELLNANTGRAAGRLPKRRYDAMRSALLKAIPRTKSGVAYKDLNARVIPLLPKWWQPEGWSVSWHVATVKLDLQARGMIENVPGARPMHVRRVK